MRCPFCAAPNRAGARFCIECGEPLDAATLAAPSAARRSLPPDPPGPAWRRSPRLREVVLGVAVLVLVLLFDRWNGAQQAARDQQAAAYRRGIAALGAQHWADAVTAFGEAGDYKDAARRRNDAQQTVTQLAHRWDEAQAAEQAGAWWAATLDYDAIAALQPDYPNVDVRRTAARKGAGPLLYRVPAAPGDPALWWATADGTDAHSIPGTDANSQIHGISPDGHWAIYSVYIEESAERHRRQPYLLDLRTGISALLVLPLDSRPGVMSAQFRTDSSGFWWQVEDQLFYAAIPVGVAWAPSGGIYPLLCAPDIVVHDPVQGLTVLLHHTQPAGEVGAPAWLDLPDSTAVLAGDTLGGNTRLLAQEGGRVEDGAISPDGRYLLYRVIQTDAAARNVNDTLVLFDLDVLKYYPGADLSIGRHVLTTVSAMRGELPYHTLRGRFVPGPTPTQPRVLIIHADDPPVLYDTLTRVSQAVATTATTDSRWQMAASPPVVSPGGRWLALEVWSATGNTILSRLVMQPTTGGPAWSMLVPTDLPTWVGFSGDERYAFYALSSFSTQGEQHSQLLSVPVPDGGGGPSVSAVKPLIDHRLPSPSWLSNVALTPDGRHLLALVTTMQTEATPGAPARAPGLYALRPDGSDWLRLAPEATDFWVAGGLPWSVPGVP